MGSEYEATAQLAACWQKGKMIGMGSFGNVYVGFDSNIGRFCAIKEAILIQDDTKSMESAKQLRQLEDRLHIYLEYASGGSIQKLLQEYGPFREPVIKRYTRQILCGLSYLHNMQTVHRDIKGANLLIDSNGSAKLADFGMAKHITAKSFARSFKGTPYWMAPETLKRKHSGYDFSVDIWSLGCTVIEMAQVNPPWSEYEPIAALYKIANSMEIPAIPDFLSEEAQDFLKLCLQRNPADRPTASQLYWHPWFVHNMPELPAAALSSSLALSNDREECFLEIEGVA